MLRMPCSAATSPPSTRQSATFARSTGRPVSLISSRPAIMADLKQTTVLKVEADDLRKIVSDALCRYGPLDALYVDHVTQLDDGNFEIVLEPKLEEAA